MQVFSFASVLLLVIGAGRTHYIVEATNSAARCEPLSQLVARSVRFFWVNVLAERLLVHKHSGALSLCSPFFRIKLCVVLERATAEKQNKPSRRLLLNKYFERGC